MFSLQTVTDTRKTDLIVLRSLLLAAALWILFHDSGASGWFRYSAALVLAGMASLASFLLIRNRVRYSWITSSAALLLLASTRNFFQVSAFLVFAHLPRFFYGDGCIGVGEQGIDLPRFGGRKSHGWSELNNLILKDGLLTIDFVSNRVIQLVIDGSKTPIDEKAFNEYCRRRLSSIERGTSFQ